MVGSSGPLPRPTGRFGPARITAITLDGLRAGAPRPLPHDPPDDTLLTARWE